MGLLDRLRGRPRAVTATLHVNAPLQPVHRGEWFEDPLDEAFKDAGVGHRVTGGGTLLTADRRIENCDVELALVPGQVDDAVAMVAQWLDARAPRGSWVQVGEGDRRPVGSATGLAVVLASAWPVDTLYDQVPGSTVVMELMKALAEALADDGDLMSWWIDDDVASELYVYGPSEERMRAAMAPVLTSHPLAEGHVVRVIA